MDRSWPGIQLYVNNAENRAFVNEWFQLMTRDNYHFVTDAPSRIPNAPVFRDHRHDQSVFSLLAKQRGIATHDHPGDKEDAPIAVTRQRYS